MNIPGGIPRLVGLRHLARTAALALGIVMAGGVAVAQEIKPGGAMIVALPGDPEVFNSGISTDISSSNISGQIFNTIVQLDAEGNAQPSLAKSWEIAPDGLTYTFHFFEGVKWHDGEPFTANDVAWSLWNVNKNYNGPSGGLLTAVESITATDNLTAVFKLKYPYPPLLKGLAYFNSSTVLPKHIYDNGTDPRQNPANYKPIGTGPFKFVEYVKGSHVVLEKNPDYHFKGQPYLDRLVFQIIPNPSARAIALEKGDIDLIPYYGIVLGEVDPMKQSDKIQIAIQRRTIAGEYLAIINNRNAPFSNKLVRQALYFAMDRNELLAKAGFGFGKVSAGPISSEQPQYYIEGKPYPHDPAMAEKLLDEAGYPKGADGKRFTMRLNFDQKEGPMNDVAQLLRVQFAKIGVDVNIMPMDTGAWVDTNFKKWNFDVTMGSFATGPDPAIGTEVRYACRFIVQQTGRNASGYCNEEVDKLFAAAGKELDETKRAEFYHKIQQLMSEDAVNWWLWDRYYPIAFNKNLKGLPQDPTAYGAFDRVGWTN